MKKRANMDRIITAIKNIVADTPNITYAKLLIAFHADKTKTLGDAFEKLGIHIRDVGNKDQFVFARNIAGSEEMFPEISNALINYAQAIRDEAKKQVLL